jgi:hypothetical protein
MSDSRRWNRVLGLVALGVLLFLGWMALGSASVHGQPADPSFEAITATAASPLRISDTMPGSAITRAIWFAEAGLLTLTVELSGTPMLTLTAGPAFEWTVPRSFTASTSPAVFAFTYTVQPTDPLALYTVVFTAESSALGLAQVALDVLPDVSPPTVTLESSLPHLITTIHPSPLTLTGTVTDTAQVGDSRIPGSGVRSVRVLTATETEAAFDPVAGVWAASWPLPASDRVTQTLRITATDFLGNASWITREAVIDRRGPAITWISPIAGAIFTQAQLSTLVAISGTASDASGVQEIRVLTDTESLASWDGSTWQALWSLPPDRDWVTYTLRVTATDGVGNSSTVTRAVGVDTRAPEVPPLFSRVPTDTWTRLSDGLPITWTAVSDNAGVWYEVQLSGDASDSQLTRTTAVTFPVGSGIYTVTLGTQDGWGNRRLATSQIGPFKVDNTPPSVSPDLPATAYRTFPVTMTASDNHSKIVSYTVAYTCDGCAGWTDFLTGTTSPLESIAVSRIFSAPVFYFTQTLVYTFTARVEDAAGNIGAATGTVRVRPAVIALPLVLRNYCPPVTIEIEPNNTRSQANCIQVPSTVQGYANDPADQYDFFQFYIDTTGPITLTLQVPSGVDLDLYLQHESDVGVRWTAWSNRTGAGVNEQIVYPVDAAHLGRFYVLVYRYSGLSAASYSLTVTR